MVVSLLATAAIVHGSGPPFTYRLGERADREIRVNVKEFRIRNQTKTSNERQAAADQVPPSMVNDPAQILDLADRLDDLTVTIAKAARFEDLREHRQGGLEAPARGLRRDQGGRRHARRSATRCTRRSPRRSGRSPATASSAPARCRPTKNRAAPCRSARRASRRTCARAVPRDRVIPERMAKPDGAVYQEFCAAFASPRIGQVLFGLIADKFDGTPTLTFEAEATAAAREAGAGGSSPTTTIPSPAARCSSSRARPSARSS